MILSAVLAAGDARARNYAVQLNGEAVTLAPLFDMASGLAYDTVSGRRPLAMGIGGSFDAAQLRREHWNRFADDARLDNELIVGRVQALAEPIPGAVRLAFEELADEDFDGHVGDVAGRMIPAIAAQAEAIAESVN